MEQTNNENNNNVDNEALNAELQELREFKAKREAQEQFNNLVTKVKPLFEKTNGRVEHVDTFVRHYEESLKGIEDNNLENWFKDTSTKDTLFFEKPKPVNTSNFFTNTSTQPTQQPTQQPKTDNIDDYFYSRTSTIRKRNK